MKWTRVATSSEYLSSSSLRGSSKDRYSTEQINLYAISIGEYKYLFNYLLVPQFSFEDLVDQDYLDSLDDS